MKLLSNKLRLNLLSVPLSSQVNRLQIVVVLALLMFTLVGVYLFIQDAIALNRVVQGPLGVDGYRIPRDVANLQRDLLKTQVLVGR
jgi:hypothetical protein